MNEPTPSASTRLGSEARRLIRPLVSPFFAWLYARIDARIDARLGPPGRGGSVVTDENLRALLDAVSRTNAELHKVGRDVVALAERQERLEAAGALSNQQPRRV